MFVDWKYKIHIYSVKCRLCFWYLKCFPGCSFTVVHTSVSIRFQFLIIKLTRCTNFSNLFFGIEIYMFRTGFLSIIRSLVLYTQQQVYLIQVMLTACQQAVSITCMTYNYCCVYSTRLLMMERKPVRNMQISIPKNKFEKLVHLVGFIIRIYHDARSSECQRFIDQLTVLHCKQWTNLWLWDGITFNYFDFRLWQSQNIVIRKDCWLHCQDILKTGCLFCYSKLD